MIVKQTGIFNRHVKKMHKKEKSALDEAVQQIILDPSIGEMKLGDLAGVQVFKYKYNVQIYLLAYEYLESVLVLTLIDQGNHENISLDYAIMERTDKAVVVPVTCGSIDVDDLNALWQTNDKDADGNVLSGDAVALDSSQCIVKAEHRLVTALGVENLAIVETKDAVLVAKLNASQGVKDLVALLKGRGELENQRDVHRPWGSYDSVDSDPNYQVKRITVKPGARLSLQKHQYRAEHWVVVEGQAKVHVDGIDHLLKANDSIYIPVGAVHCLANETDETLHLVEVQSGSYLGEDDIERLEDLYGRH